LQSKENEFLVGKKVLLKGIVFGKEWRLSRDPANVTCPSQKNSYFCESVRWFYAREITAVKVI